MFKWFKLKLKLKKNNMDSNNENDSNLESDKTSEEKMEKTISIMKAMGHNFDEIETNLLLGAHGLILSRETIHELKIKRILSVTSEPIVTNLMANGVDYKHIKADDICDYDLLSNFPKCIQYIKECLESGQTIYVHCQAGISRSSSAVIAYLMHKNKIPFRTALRTVLTKRVVLPNEGFVRQLQLFEEMNYTLNANNLKYRQFLVRVLVFHLNRSLSSTKFQDFIDEYHEKLASAEAMTEDLCLGQMFECIECNYGLFNDINVIKNENPDENRVKETDVSCDNVFIEPQKWMSHLFGERNISTLDEGVVKCPQCSAHIANLDFYLGLFSCNCPLHIRINNNCLILKMDNQKFRPRANTTQHS